MDARVDVWLVRTDLPAPIISSLEPVLDDGERVHADALRWPAERRRYIAAHGAFRFILANRLGTEPEQIRLRRGPHGKPELDDGPHVNLSRSGDLAAVAISDQRPVGVDVQELSPWLNPARMAARFFPADEAAHVAEADSLDRFVRLWVRKEACVKAAGGRLWPGLSLRVSQDVVPGQFLVTDIPAPAGFRAAVALAGDRPYRTAIRWWFGDTLPSVNGITAELARMLIEVMGENLPITTSTRLEHDLRLESIEVVALADLIRQRWGESVDLAALYAGLDIDQVIALTVGDIACYVSGQVEARA